MLNVALHPSRVPAFFLLCATLFFVPVRQRSTFGLAYVTPQVHISTICMHGKTTGLQSLSSQYLGQQSSAFYLKLQDKNLIRGAKLHCKLGQDRLVQFINCFEKRSSLLFSMCLLRKSRTNPVLDFTTWRTEREKNFSSPFFSSSQKCFQCLLLRNPILPAIL